MLFNLKVSIYIDSGADTPTNANALCNVILTASIRATCAFVFQYHQIIPFQHYRIYGMLKLGLEYN